MQTRTDTVAKCAVIYVRVSSTRQEDEGTSLETQLDRCRAHARARGWQVVAEFRDTHTATELHERPQLTSLRQMIRSGVVDIVVCYAVDRLSRNQAHVYILAEEFERAGITLSFVTEDFEQSAVGKFIRSAKAFAAEVEHEKIRERTVRGRIRRVESGKLIPGGKPLYGYRWIDQDGKSKAALAIDDSAAAVVRRIFADVASGKSLRQIARDLVTEGIPTPTGRGSHWYTSTIAQILHKPAYKGEAYGWGWRKGGTTPQTFDPSKAIPLPEGTVPPIVDAELWDAVQPILTRNKDRAIRSAKNPEAALLRGGFVQCGYCGQAMYARPRNNSSVEYACHPRANSCDP
ncbi:MAG: recombinase family protein [Chloroflexota bacterium]|nr:recombinase family protein [Chloroflexota bacterium]